MKISTKGRYTARAMLELATAYGKGPIRLIEIAKNQEISVKYLERMMTAMVHAGFVHSARGQKGGYFLARLPEDILLSDVVQAVEGSFAPSSCVDTPDICNRNKYCVTRDIWTELKEAMVGVLNSYTLADMVDMQKQKNL